MNAKEMDEHHKKAVLEMIDTVIAERFKVSQKPQYRILDAIRSKLREQGTQRGLTLLLPILIVRIFKLDPQTAIDVVTGVLCLYGVHNVATEG